MAKYRCWWKQPEKKIEPYKTLKPDVVAETSAERKRLAKYLEQNDPEMLEFIKEFSRTFAVEGKRTPIERVEYARIMK